MYALLIENIMMMFNQSECLKRNVALINEKNYLVDQAQIKLSELNQHAVILPLRISELLLICQLRVKLC